MNTLDYIVKKFNINLSKSGPFDINVSRFIHEPKFECSIANLFNELNFKSGVEIGVHNGQFSELLCRDIPEATIYSVDAWREYPLYKMFRKEKHYKVLYEDAKNVLSKYKNSKIIRKWSIDAVNDFEDNSLDFIFIDSDHRFQAITNDIAEWGKKVKIGGIICGHDWGEGAASKDFVHVKSVVEAWTYSYGIHPLFIFGAKKDRSWMWVKEREII